MGERYGVAVRDADEFVRELVHRNVAFSELEVAPVSLEDAVLLLMQGEDQ